MPDVCVACLEPIVIGEDIALIVDGWAHDECAEVTR